jgi:phosphoribosylglycinamide formyltransferase-1
MRIGFFASHRGSNMQAVLEACVAERLPATPCVLITNNRAAEAIGRAHQSGLPVHVLNASTHPDPVALDEAMLRALQASKCELIVLAGFMKMIGPRVLAAYRNRIVNIHPSLLPRHGGKGMYGMHVHAAVIASGDSTTGVTVHLVDEAYDHGRVLAQSRLSVEPRDTPESLSARILKSEHAFLVETLGRICRRELALDLPG